MGFHHMSDEIDLRVLGLASISHRCARETEFFFQRQRYDPRYCYELFRRAIIDRSQQAWELIYVQYRPLVAGWVGRHPAFPVSGEEVQYFVNRAFEKMWGALSSDKFGRFPDLKSLLRYLQMCVHSVVVDQARAAEQALVDVQLEAAAAHSASNAPREADRALAGVYRQEFWDQIRARLNDEKEQLVVYGSFVLALKPRELYAQSKGVFRDVKEVYRVKENVLARLRRDAELAEILGPDA
jgi:DNA-directed RNA polymerase specialized sigma24 family protein